MSARRPPPQIRWLFVPAKKATGAHACNSRLWRRLCSALRARVRRTRVQACVCGGGQQATAGRQALAPTRTKKKAQNSAHILSAPAELQSLTVTRVQYQLVRGRRAEGERVHEAVQRTRSSQLRARGRVPCSFFFYSLRTRTHSGTSPCFLSARSGTRLPRRASRSSHSRRLVSRGCMMSSMNPRSAARCAMGGGGGHGRGTVIL